MMTNLEATVRLARGMVDAVRIPVTAKMRLGWDADNITAPDLARALEDAGVAAVFVHGRTRAQGFGGTVNLPGIRAVVEAVKRIPVIGNGDVTTPEAAQKMVEETGCAGVSIGRGAFYNPWIFQHTQEYLASGRLPSEPTFEERVRVMSRHLDKMIEIFGEHGGCLMFRKIAPWYARRFGPAKEFSRQATLISSKADFERVMAHYREWRCQFLDGTGELKPRYQPPPLVASFMRPAGEEIHTGIGVPKGPVETW